MRWSSAFAFLYSLIMNFPCLHWACLPAAPSRVRCWPGTAACAAPSVKELEEGAWEDGLVDSLCSVPQVLSSVPHILFPRTGYWWIRQCGATFQIPVLILGLCIMHVLPAWLSCCLSDSKCWYFWWFTGDIQSFCSGKNSWVFCCNF